MPVRADLARIGLYSVREMVNDPELYGVVPALALREASILTTESLKAAPERKQSGISRPNRLPGPRVETYVASAGAINFEMMFCPEFDNYLEEGFCETFTTVNISSALISASSVDNSINDTSVGGTLFANIPVGSWIPISGFATGANNTTGDNWAYVSSKPTATKLILSFITLVTEAVGATVVISFRILRDGTKLISRTWERRHLDLTDNAYWYYPGVVINELALTFNFEEIIKGTATCMGQRPVGPRNATIGTGSPVAPVDISYLADVSNRMKAFRTGPGGVAALDGNLKNLTISLKNAMDPIRLAMQATPVGQSMGTAALEGSIEGILLEDDGRQLKAANDEPDGYSFRVTDVLSRTYYFTIWRLKYNEKGDVPKSAITGSAMTSFPYTAEMDPTTGHWIQVCASPST